MKVSTSLSLQKIRVMEVTRLVACFWNGRRGKKRTTVNEKNACTVNVQNIKHLLEGLLIPPLIVVKKTYGKVSLESVEKDTQPVTWRQMASQPWNNQPSAVICRISCQQRPRGSACVKQTFAQRPFSFFYFCFYISVVFYGLVSTTTSTPGILRILKTSGFVGNQGTMSTVKGDLSFSDAEDPTSGHVAVSEHSAKMLTFL